jgi:flagellar motility protein MotE (MotC chaperone)
VNKRLIVMIAAGLVSFGGGFVYSWFTRTVPATQSQDEPELNESMASEEQSWPLPQGASAVQTGQSRLSMTEKQLRALVFAIQDNIRKYENKLASLETDEQRLHTARETLKQDIEKLNSLRVELASMAAHLKSERDRLIKSRVEIAQAEKANLISIAATYDRMDEAAASKILTNMCVGEQGSQSRTKVFGGSGSNMDDAVKILHYMGEKTKANVLAEMVNSEPRLAALLCEKLKQITEQG